MSKQPELEFDSGLASHPPPARPGPHPALALRKKPGPPNRQDLSPVNHFALKKYIYYFKYLLLFAEWRVLENF